MIITYCTYLITAAAQWPDVDLGLGHGGRPCEVPGPCVPCVSSVDGTKLMQVHYPSQQTSSAAAPAAAPRPTNRPSFGHRGDPCVYAQLAAWSFPIRTPRLNHRCIEDLVSPIMFGWDSWSSIYYFFQSLYSCHFPAGSQNFTVEKILSVTRSLCSLTGFCVSVYFELNEN